MHPVLLTAWVHDQKITIAQGQCNLTFAFDAMTQVKVTVRTKGE